MGRGGEKKKKRKKKRIPGACQRKENPALGRQYIAGMYKVVTRAVAPQFVFSENVIHSWRSVYFKRDWVYLKNSRKKCRKAESFHGNSKLILRLE